ncbi:1,6-anhydro-N-acetylmuramyl-L-alanine amidase AmpD [Thalassotalea litorea]|uniref:1,6-anhydro-N-acetylmuramyl-L-alanine amidase AmpD n=1 Tax=Thalassotalea litorea TaxID=2020715 RepID=A0A5R9IMI3_9GAMM|nr:1,6-anhydro-N-acetylmuramyl-L-alanine amidase AmpD [Thalassotalea litorea]TLU66745.1 1,6-anhydro-N-acetylmuramyl-L-alanine amidase AmpD [Thalassotalea litorea]
MIKNYTINQGWLADQDHFSQGVESSDIRQCPSPFYDEREGADISLLVVHNISLPPGQFGGNYIDQLFTGKLNPKEHEYFQDIYQFKVSAHCLIKRNGDVVQYVPFEKRAWHAGVSVFNGRSKCNDFSIGIELEGCDDVPYTEVQYQQLAAITRVLQKHYPLIAKNHITGHCDIAPGRKTDPGESFNWSHYFSLLK